MGTVTFQLGYGDLGYDEFELLPGGHTEHRMLFSSGIEVELRFRDFRFTCQPAKSERCPALQPAAQAAWATPSGTPRDQEKPK